MSIHVDVAGLAPQSSQTLESVCLPNVQAGNGCVEKQKGWLAMRALLRLHLTARGLPPCVFLLQHGGSGSTSERKLSPPPCLLRLRCTAAAAAC